MTNKPIGNEFEEAEFNFNEKYKDNPELLKEVDRLKKLLSNWHIQVFLSVQQETKERMLTEVNRKLDGF